MPFDPSAVRPGSTFSNNPIYRAGIIVYVNGLEIPIIGLETQCGIWQIPSFTIHLVPDIALQRLGAEDRVPVQVFYLDQWYNPRHPEFRLLIDGEIVGWSMSSFTGQQSMAFSCLSHINVFQQLYFFYMTDVDNIIAAQSPEVQANSFTSSAPNLLYPYSLFYQGLVVTNTQVAEGRPLQPRRPGQPGQTENPQNTPQNADPNTAEQAQGPTQGPQPIKAPFEFMYNIIKGVIGAEVPNERRAIPMMNFFARHIRKTRLHNRFVRLPVLEDAANLADRKGVFPIFNAVRSDMALNAMQRQVVSQIGNSGPVWNLLQQVFSMVFMELAMIPNPAAVLVRLSPQPGPGNAAEPSDGEITGFVSSTLPLVDYRAPNVEAQLEALATHAENLAASIRASVRAGLAPNPAELEAAGFETSPSSEIEIDSGQIYDYLEQQFLNSAGPNGGGAAPPAQAISPSTPIRLAQYFVKPEFRFGVPPHCNVIFPSMVDGFTYDEPYLPQPTRVYINDSVMTNLLRAQGPNRELMLHALTVGYPEEADALMAHKVGTAAEGQSSGSLGAGSAPGTHASASPTMLESGKNLLIWPEEFYKGPVTGRMALPPWFQMLRQFSNSQAQTMGGTPANAQGTAPGQTQIHNPNPSTQPNTPQPQPVPSTGNQYIGPTPVPGGQRPSTPRPVVTGGGASGRGGEPPATAAPRTPNGSGNAPAPLSQIAPANEPQRIPLPTNNPANPAGAGAMFVGTGPYRAGRLGNQIFLNPDRLTHAYGNSAARAVREGARFRIRIGGGLDPSNYRPLAITSLWPQRPPAGNRGVRGRVTPSPFQDRSQVQKRAQLFRMFHPRVRAIIPNMTPEQIWAATFAVLWVALTEGAANRMYNWGYGNHKQYDSSRVLRIWTVQPDDQAYVGADSPEQAADYHINTLMQLEWAYCMQVALTGQTTDPILRGLLRECDARWPMHASFFRDAAPVRPDYLYVALGYHGYYATEHDVRGVPRVENNIRRGRVGISRFGGMQRYYTAIHRLWDTDTIPPDVITITPVPSRPLLSPEDFAFLQREYSTAQARASTTPRTSQRNRRGNQRARSPSRARSSTTRPVTIPLIINTPNVPAQPATPVLETMQTNTTPNQEGVSGNQGRVNPNIRNVRTPATSPIAPSTAPSTGNNNE